MHRMWLVEEINGLHVHRSENYCDIATVICRVMAPTDHGYQRVGVYMPILHKIAAVTGHHTKGMNLAS